MAKYGVGLWGQKVRTPTQAQARTAASREETLKRIRNGYATQADRRNATLIRKWQASGVKVTADQIEFAEMVEAAVVKEAK